MSKTPAAGARPVAPHVDPADTNRNATADAEAAAAKAAEAQVAADAEAALKASQKNADAEKPADAGTTVAGVDPSNVEKVTVKTSGAFILMDPITGNHFDEDSNEPVTKTTFVASKLETGELIEA